MWRLFITSTLSLSSSVEGDKVNRPAGQKLESLPLWHAVGNWAAFRLWERLFPRSLPVLTPSGGGLTRTPSSYSHALILLSFARISPGA